MTCMVLKKFMDTWLVTIGLELEKYIYDILIGNGFCKRTPKNKPGKPLYLIQQNHKILARMACLVKDG